MAKRSLAAVLVLVFFLSTLSSCIHVPPGQLKKQMAPGHVKKKGH